jgi:hypothetical protein
MKKRALIACLVLLVLGDCVAGPQSYQWLHLRDSWVAAATNLAGSISEQVNDRLMLGDAAHGIAPGEFGHDLVAQERVLVATLEDGPIRVRFSHDAPWPLQDKVLVFYPVMRTTDPALAWTCGKHLPPDDMVDVDGKTHDRARETTVPENYLRLACR